MTSQLVEFTQLSQAYAHLSRLLACRQKEYSVIIATDQCKIMLSSCEQQNSYGYQLILNVNNTPLTLNLDSTAVDNLLPGRLEHNAVAALPPDLLTAALHHSLDNALQELAHACNIPVGLVGLKINKESSQDAGLMITADIKGSICTGTLSTSDTLLFLLENLPAAKRSEVVVPFIASIEIGRSLLTPAELKDVEVGDIVFLQQHVTEQHLIIRLNRDTAFIAQTEGSQVVIQQRIAPMEDEQRNEQYDESHEQSEEVQAESQQAEGEVSEAGVDLSSLSVELVFEVGRQQFNINELQELQPGFVFELDSPIEQPVQIRANGKVIAECQIVQIESRLGAKITKLK